MKILYGIQGTGNGHVSRSTQIIDCLQRLGVNIDIIFSGCDENKVYDRSVIAPIGFYKGFTFTTREGRIRYLDTIRNLSLIQFAKDVISFNARKYDLIITDFEPITSMIAKKRKLPCIGIGHQYAFLYDIPEERTGPLDHIIMNNFAPAQYPIGIHWHHFDHPIIPPVVPQNIPVPDNPDPSLILVYLPFEESAHIEQVLKPFKEYTFAVYAGGPDQSVCRKGNIQWSPFSKTGFYNDLGRCRGVICNAGFELPSEALHLGKKLLVKPLKGQFEQLTNAMTLKMLNLGMAMDDLDSKSISQFLEQTDSPKAHYPHVAHSLAEWIITGDWEDDNKLIKKVWN